MSIGSNTRTGRVEHAVQRIQPVLLLSALCVFTTGCAQFMAEQIRGVPRQLADQGDIDRRAKFYEDNDQDRDTARRNAKYDFIWENGRFPE